MISSWALRSRWRTARLLHAEPLLVVLAAATGVFIGDDLSCGLARSVVGPRLVNRSECDSRVPAVPGLFGTVRAR